MLLLEKNIVSTDREFFFEICKKEYDNDKVKLVEIQLFENTYTSDDVLRSGFDFPR
jgi:hypothetical protein